MTNNTLTESATINFLTKEITLIKWSGGKVHTHVACCRKHIRRHKRLDFPAFNFESG
jgi:hypothetical protein